MRRVALACVLALVLKALIAALAVVFQTGPLPVLPAVVLIAYAALWHPPIEAALSAALVGIIIDALMGVPLGVNSLAAVLTLVASRPTLVWVPEPRGVAVTAFVAGFSAVHAAIAVLLLLLFGGLRASTELMSVFTIGVVNGLLSIALFPAYRALLVRLHLEERGASLHERLASRFV